MFVSDAHLFVPREIRWSRVMAVRFSATRRRKSLARRLKRDLRVLLPVLTLAFTFATTVVTAELATILVPTGATQSPGAEAMQQTVARILAPSVPPAPEKPARVAAGPGVAPSPAAHGAARVSVAAPSYALLD